MGAAQLVSSLRVGAPLAPVLLLLLLAEAAKSATARAQDTELGARRGDRQIGGLGRGWERVLVLGGCHFVGPV